eukprot:1158384-Pelagomonas_calceolata.AAC.16
MNRSPPPGAQWAPPSGPKPSLSRVAHYNRHAPGCRSKSRVAHQAADQSCRSRSLQAADKSHARLQTKAPRVAHQAAGPDRARLQIEIMCSSPPPSARQAADQSPVCSPSLGTPPDCLGSQSQQHHAHAPRPAPAWMPQQHRCTKSFIFEIDLLFVLGITSVEHGHHSWEIPSWGTYIMPCWMQGT